MEQTDSHGAYAAWEVWGSASPDGTCRNAHPGRGIWHLTCLSPGPDIAMVTSPAIDLVIVSLSSSPFF